MPLNNDRSSHLNFLSFFLLLLLLLLNSVLLISGAIPFAKVPTNYNATIFAASLNAPRQLSLVPSTGDILVLESGIGQVTLLYDENQDGVSAPNERIALIVSLGLNHGLLYLSPFIYASNETTVLRWQYSESTRTVTAGPQVFVANIPPANPPSSFYETRSLAYNTGCTTDCLLYVHIGAGSNVDNSTNRSMVRSFLVVSWDDANLPYECENGTLIGAGLRNSVGLGFQQFTGKLWGMESSENNLYRADLGGDIHQYNPAEEMMRFDQNGLFYGYPYCWTEYNLTTVPGGPVLGRQWSWTGGNATIYTDEWCRSVSNNVPPNLAVEAHVAPLGLVFYEFYQYQAPSLPAPSPYAFPESSSCGAYSAFHGSTDTTINVGYKVVCISFSDSNEPVAYEDFFSYDSSSDWGPDWIYRPVDLIVGNYGELFFTSDGTGNGEVVRIGKQRERI